jgi:predicted dienelactone hydrolase
MRLLFGLIMLVIVGCAEEVERLPVEPLAANEQALRQLYKWGPGPNAVKVRQNLALPHATREGELLINVFYPDSEEQQLPVLLFAHGNFSDNTKYGNLIEHWVSHGYVVIAPLHLDGKGGYLGATINLVKYGNFGLIQARYDDMLTALNAFDVIEKLVPELSGRLDSDRVAATGHSFGAFTAQQFGGAAAQDMDSGNYVDLSDPRIKAVLAISPPGPMFDEINESSWRAFDKPALLTTGTWDTNSFFWPDWRRHKMAFDTAVAVDQYALVVQGADHYLGNLICRPELEEPAQHDALAMVNNLSVAFLDAYLNDIPEALAYLQSSTLENTTAGFAVLEKR